MLDEKTKYHWHTSMFVCFDNVLRQRSLSFLTPNFLPAIVSEKFLSLFRHSMTLVFQSCHHYPRGLCWIIQVVLVWRHIQVVFGESCNMTVLWSAVCRGRWPCRPFLFKQRLNARLFRHSPIWQSLSNSTSITCQSDIANLSSMSARTNRLLILAPRHSFRAVFLDRYCWRRRRGNLSIVPNLANLLIKKYTSSWNVQVYRDVAINIFFFKKPLIIFCLRSTLRSHVFNILINTSE